MILHWPQVCMLFFMAVEVAFVLAIDGTPKTGKHNFWLTAFLYATLATLLGFGGFWSGVAQ